jgi:RNA polymerase sigma-70 factor (ECF subfamily)
VETPAERLTQREFDPGDASVLVAAVRAGELEALAALYRHFAGPLLAVAYRLLLNRADAEDVVHDLFVGLPEGLRKYEERGALGPWLKRVTVRLALSRLRAPERRGVELTERSAAAAADPVLDRIALAAALARLSPSLRAVLDLKEIEGFTHAEIAGLLGISTAASEVRLHRALRALRRALVEAEES